MFKAAFLFASLSPLTLGCAGPPGTTTRPAEEQPVAAKESDRPARAKRFAGTLHGGIVAIGAETTGWVLESKELGRVDIDVTKAADAAAENDGRAVVVEGELVTVNWPERGERRMLMAESIRPADADNADDNGKADGK
jgi:hypothetical protein